MKFGAFRLVPVPLAGVGDVGYAKKLQRASPANWTNVTGSLGFWHAGRFATSYTERFGVRPATTLRSGAVTAVR